MTESFLHYVWQYQYFDKTGLATTSGEPVSVFLPGMRNSDSGPDFFNAKVKIGAMRWVGSVEIHILSSGWTDHRHDLDAAYENVILHVVWKEDRKIKRRDQSELPTIELRDRVDNTLLLQYRKLVNNPAKIPCARSFHQVGWLAKVSMVEKTLAQRLETKATRVHEMLRRNNGDWDETAYQLLCRNFGFKVNAGPFEQLAQGLPYKVLVKHADKILQVEALLFGQAGFLDDDPRDDYYAVLKREHDLLSKKYNLGRKRMHRTQWKFLRLRPANFPTLRIGQLASLLCDKRNILSRILEAASYADLTDIFSVRQTGYWQNHYQFFKPMGESVASVGSVSIDNMIINSAVPLLAAYGKHKDDQLYIDRAVDILQHMAPEENAVVRIWKELGFVCRSAADTQSLIELYSSFCLRRKCLDCKIGFAILEPSGV